LDLKNHKKPKPKKPSFPPLVAAVIGTLHVYVSYLALTVSAAVQVCLEHAADASIVAVGG